MSKNPSDNGILVIYFVHMFFDDFISKTWQKKFQYVRRGVIFFLGTIPSWPENSEKLKR